MWQAFNKITTLHNNLEQHILFMNLHSLYYVTQIARVYSGPETVLIFFLLYCDADCLDAPKTKQIMNSR